MNDRRAGHDDIRVADTPGGEHLEIAGKRATRQRQTAPQGIGGIVGDHGVVHRSTCHGHGVQSVEFVAQFLPALPGHELLTCLRL